ncbi:hypothetical protein VTI74DRAFT_70 [Chaetomium olivicolor]
MASEAASDKPAGFYDFTALDNHLKEIPMSDFKGKVVLIVNTASKCGFTPQYAGLEKLYKSVREKHGDKFQILGFPCNQFGAQEPGNDAEIETFCERNYGVTFPIMTKIDVNGADAHPLFEWLKAQQRSMGMKRIKWNFEKFLVGKDGTVKNRYSSFTTPESLEAEILEELAKE